MRTLLIVLCVTASAVAQEDYRWRMLGENGEEFVMTILGAVPHISENDDSTGYAVTGFDLQFNLPFDPVHGPPYQVVPQFDSYADVGPGGAANRFSLVVEERPDLLFTFSGNANPGYTAYIDDWGNDQAFSSRFYEIDVRNTFGYDGRIVSVSSIPIPEPSTIYISVTSLIMFFLRCRRPRRVRALDSSQPLNSSTPHGTKVV